MEKKFPGYDGTQSDTTLRTNPEANESPLRARWRTARIVVFVLLLSCLALIGMSVTLFGALYLYFAQQLPASPTLDVQQLSQSVKILDRNGNLLYEVNDPEGGRRTLVQFNQIPSVLKQAVLATEDPTFYSNVGVDPLGVVRAIYYQVRYERMVGGSTITQQLVKNLFLDTDPTIWRKIREAFLALEITRRYSKNEILTAYLNTIYYGNLSYGIQAASQSYFGKDVSQLNLAEASLLAGLPQAPSTYDPCEDASAALDRQKIVLDLMQKEGDITSAQADTAASEMAKRLRAPDFAKRCRDQITLQAPHFVTYVRAQLEKQFGPEVLYRGGLRVTTTLDPQMQAIAEDEAKKQIAALRGKNVSNAAVVILNPRTGEILAMVGSVDFFDEAISGQVNMATAPRQPGSSIKPLNYVTAFKNGWTPATPLYDLKTNFPDGNGRPPFVPVNYDDKYHGIVSARTALASSLNIPAVKTLYSTSTKDANNFPQPLAMLDTARQLGITTLTDAQGRPRQTFGLALTLGGGAVELLELTDAYATFANQGTYTPPLAYTKIVDASGHVVFDAHGKDKPKARCAQFDPNASNEQPDANNFCAHSAPYAYLITNILSDNNARALAFGTNSVLKLSRPAAVKTGTTNDFRDNWTLGYTPDLVVGVWVGNADNAPMQNVSGISGAAPIWHNVMERALANSPARDFPIPAGIVKAPICSDSGLLATNLCPRDRQHVEIFVAGHAPTQPDTVWQRVPCGAGQTSQVFVVPVHDVGDLIPYDQILNWAQSIGAPVLPLDSNACGMAPADSGNGNGNGKGNGKGHKKKP